MGLLTTSVLVLFALVCVFLIFLVMVQTGKGGSVGGMLSGGSSGSVFGASTADVMTRVTRWTGVTFIVLALLLSFLYSKKEDALVPETPVKASFDQAPDNETSNEKSTEAPIGE